MIQYKLRQERLTWLGNSNVLRLPVAQASLNYKAKREHTRSSLGPLPRSYCVNENPLNLEKTASSVLTLILCVLQLIYDKSIYNIRIECILITYLLLTKYTICVGLIFKKKTILTRRTRIVVHHSLKKSSSIFFFFLN